MGLSVTDSCSNPPFVSSTGPHWAPLTGTDVPNPIRQPRWAEWHRGRRREGVLRESRWDEKEEEKSKRNERSRRKRENYGWRKLKSGERGGMEACSWWQLCCRKDRIGSDQGWFVGPEIVFFPFVVTLECASESLWLVEALKSMVTHNDNSTHNFPPSLFFTHSSVYSYWVALSWCLTGPKVFLLPLVVCVCLISLLSVMCCVRFLHDFACVILLVSFYCSLYICNDHILFCSVTSRSMAWHSSSV